MDQFIDKLAAFMNEYPPLWIVYGFVLVLPFVLMAFCCVKPRTKDDAARRKKTDEPSPDEKPKDKKTRQTADVSSPSPLSVTIASESLKGAGERQREPEGTGVESLRHRGPQSEGNKADLNNKDADSTGVQDVSKHTIYISEEDASPKKGKLTGSNDSETIKEEEIGSMVVISQSEELSVPEEESNVETIGAATTQKDSLPASGQAKPQRTDTQSQATTKTPGTKDSSEDPKMAAATQSELVVEGDKEKENVPEERLRANGDVKRFQFPPVLEDFDLMECEADPSVIEEYFEDKRLKEIWLCVEEGNNLGLSIVGGSDSPNGNLPIYIKKVASSGVAGQVGQLGEGDQLFAVNDKILLECTLEYALTVLRNASGDIRLLIIGDY